MGCLKKYSYEGSEYTIDELVDKYGLCAKQIRSRLKDGIPLDKKIGRGKGHKSKYSTFQMDGEEITMTEAMHRCHCNKNTLYKHLHEGMSLEEIREYLNKKRVAANGKADYEPGWITVEQVAKKFNVPKQSLSWIVRSRGIERKNFVSVRGKRMAIKRVDIDKAVRLTLEMLSKEEKKNKVIKEEKEKSLEELRKEHPLVKDDKFFETSYFPHLDTFHIEDWLGKPAEVEA